MNQPTHETANAATTESTIQKYLNSLSPKEYKAYIIAKSHLGTSFDMEKSIGYIGYRNPGSGKTS